MADRKVFANRHTLIANETSLPRAPLLGKTPPAGGGGTQVPKGERLSSECETERLYEEQLHLELTAIETLFVRVRVSLCFSFSSVGLALSGADAPAVPLFGFAIFPRPGEIFPKGGAFGKEINFAWTAKASHFERLPRPGEVARKCQKGTRWHGEAVTERARMLAKSKKHSDTSPVCQRHRIAVLSCFILPGLPSQALARQLSQRESPWQRGQALVYASMPWSAGG